MKLKPLLLKDKPLFDKFFKKDVHSLSSFSFVNIFIWRDFFDFFWGIIEGNLCIFAKNKIGCFMYLPPVGGEVSARLLEDCFKLMNTENLDRNISRIENIEEKDREAFCRKNLILKEKDSEYIYPAKSLINLSGNNFKAKRAVYNYFLKNYNFEYLKFEPKFKAECLNLYKNWSDSRKLKYQDSIYQSMLDDNLMVHKRCFDFYKELGLLARIVKIKGKIKAYTFGFKLNKDIFCILLEVADLSFKGLAQFIFREFAKELRNFKFINVMDDSGLENLKRVKLSYRPLKLVNNYVAYRY